MMIPPRHRRDLLAIASAPLRPRDQYPPAPTCSSGWGCLTNAQQAGIIVSIVVFVAIVSWIISYAVAKCLQRKDIELRRTRRHQLAPRPSGWFPPPPPPGLQPPQFTGPAAPMVPGQPCPVTVIYPGTQQPLQVWYPSTSYPLAVTVAGNSGALALQPLRAGPATLRVVPAVTVMNGAAAHAGLPPAGPRPSGGITAPHPNHPRPQADPDSASWSSSSSSSSTLPRHHHRGIRHKFGSRRHKNKNQARCRGAAPRETTPSGTRIRRAWNQYNTLPLGRVTSIPSSLEGSPERGRAAGEGGGGGDRSDESSAESNVATVYSDDYIALHVEAGRG